MRRVFACLALLLLCGVLLIGQGTGFRLRGQLRPKTADTWSVGNAFVLTTQDPTLQRHFSELAGKEIQITIVSAGK